MTQTIALFGRQPALGMAELESLFGANPVHPLGSQAAVVNCDPQNFPMQRLGGTMKAAKLLTYIDSTDWRKIESYLKHELPKHTCCLPPGKIRLGLSVHGLHVGVRQLNATGLTLKKVVKNPPDGEGRSVRVVPNSDLQLNTAQIIHNQLTGPTGMELVLVRDGNRTALAQTFAVQDINAYAARDQARPHRDARVGMLPPKLAQIIVNLATGKIQSKEHGAKSKANSITHGSPLSAPHNIVVLDPFCGTGVILQEALIMGYLVMGSDIEERMTAYTHKNLEWLYQQNKYPEYLIENLRELSCVDATTADWEGLPSVIACETYLGQPFSSEPTPEKLRQVMQDVDTIHRKFLQNVARQTKPGFRMCIAVPSWKTKNGFKHLKVLDSLEELGYNRISFVHTGTRDLIYHRENQVVGRELVVLQRI